MAAAGAEPPLSQGPLTGLPATLSPKGRGFIGPTRLG
jgi:hypothetical protein